MKTFLVVIATSFLFLGGTFLAAKILERSTLGPCPDIDWLYTTEPCTVLTPDDIEKEKLYVIRETNGTIRVIRSPEPLPKRFIIAIVGNKKTVVPYPEDKK